MTAPTEQRPGYSPSPGRYYIAAIATDLAFALQATSLPWLVVSHLHAGEATLGLIGAAGTLCYTAVALLAGTLARQFAPRHIALCAAVLVVMGNVGIASCQFLAPVAGFVALSSLGMGLFWPALQAQLSHSGPPDTLSTRLSRFNLSWSSGLALGPLSAGRLYPLERSLPFLAAAGSMVLVAALMATAPGFESAGAHDGKPINQNTDRDGHLEDQDQFVGSTAALPVDEPATTARTGSFPPHLLAAWSANFGSFFAAAIIRSFYPVLASFRGVPLPTQGDLLFEMGIVQTAGFAMMIFWGSWQRRKMLLPGSLALQAGAIALVATRPSAGFQAIAFAGIGVSAMMIYALSIFHSLDAEDRSRNAGFHEAIIGGSSLCGSLAGGFTGERFGLVTPFYCAVAALLITMFPAIILLWRKNPGPFERPGRRE